MDAEAVVEVFPVGSEFGVVETVIGERAPVPLPAVDARTFALRELRKFISLLVFNRPGRKGGKLESFTIEPKNIHLEQPDHVKDMRFPAIAFIPGRGRYETFGLGPARLDESTYNVYAPGTALVQIAEYTEMLTLEAWATKIPERRAIIAGLETVLGSFDNSWSLTLRIPNYFNRTATFSLAERQNIDEPDNVRNRRRAHMFIELTVGIVRLVNVTDLTPYVALDC